MKGFFSALLLACWLATPAGANPVEDLAGALKAESFFAVADREPKEGEPIGHLYINATGAHVLDMRVESVRLEARDVVLAPKEQWTDGEVKFKSMADASLSLTINASDIDNYCDGAVFYHGEVTDVSVSLLEDQLKLTGTFHTVLWGMNLPVRISLTTGFEPRGAGKLWLQRPRVSTFGIRLPSDIQRRLLSKIEPLVDLTRWGVTAQIDQPQISPQGIWAGTKSRPRPFFGAWTLEQ